MINKIKKVLIENDLEQALELILENDQNYKDNVEFINCKGVLAIKAGEFDIAINHLEYAKNLIKNNKVFYNLEQDINELEIDIYYNLAFSYAKFGDMDKEFIAYQYILNNTKDETEKLEVSKIIDRIKNKRKEQIEMTYGKDNIIDENEYGKVKIKDISYKQTPEIANNIYEGRQNLNKLIEDENPLVSISVLAYNNLEKHTKKCIESILEYSSDIDYELILIDNGSTDGTYEYFKSIDYYKKKIIRITKNVGIGYGLSSVFSETKGKYISFITNDTIVTKNWLSNLVKCLESDTKIGMASPMSDFISNFQSVNLGYTDIEDMQKKAAIYNNSNPNKWHEKLKIITLGTLFRRECIDMIGSFDYGFIHDYSDDDITFRVRRAGYKAILCKDTFISHGSKVTDKGLEVCNISLKRGREFFKNKYYGIESQDSMNYELGMLSLIDNDDLYERKYSALGIDTLCGTPILELKNKLREKGYFNTQLKAFSTDAKYWLDLNTICDDVVVDRIDYLLEHYNEKFDYIVLGKKLNLYENPYKVLSDLAKLINDKGSILLRCKNSYDIKTFLHSIGRYMDTENQNIKNIDINLLNKRLMQQGFKIENILAEINRVNDDIKQYLKELLKNEQDYESIVDKILIDNYILKICKI